MNPLLALQAQGFQQALPILGTTIAFNGLQKPCIASNIQLQSRLTLTGLELIADPAAQMFRADFLALQLPPRAEVEIDGVTLVFVGLDGDAPDDPCVNLKLEHKTKNGRTRFRDVV